jgi:hypothetical protein
VVLHEPARSTEALVVDHVLDSAFRGDGLARDAPNDFAAFVPTRGALRRAVR